MSELLPCPFCEGEAKTYKGIFNWYAACCQCPAELGADYDADGNPEGEYDTEELAAKAWNTRHRETCEVNGTSFWEWEWSDFTAYYEHELSCGHVVNTMEPEPPSFCPECGRKIRKAVER